MPLDKKNHALTFLALLLLNLLSPLAVPGQAEERGNYVWTGKAAQDTKNLSELCFLRDITSSDVLWANDYSEKKLPPEGTVLMIPASKKDVLAVWQKVQAQNKTGSNLVSVKLHGIPSFVRSEAPIQSLSTPQKTQSQPNASPEKQSASAVLPTPKSIPPETARPAPKPTLQQDDKVFVNEDVKKTPSQPPLEGSSIRLVVSGDQVVIIREPRTARSETFKEASGFSGIRLPPPATGMNVRTSSKMIWPVSGRVSSPFGKRGRRGFHTGIDIPMPKGTPIRAAQAGVVTQVIPLRSRGFNGYGNVVVIDHGNGLSTWYAHCLGFKVKPGQRIRQGDVIATVGRTGRATTDHVHFEVRVQGRPVNPMNYLSSRF